VVREGRRADPTATADAIDRLVPDLEAVGADADAIEALRAGAQVLRDGDGDINAARVEAEFRRVLREVEQLELGLAGTASPVGGTGEDAATGQAVSERAADYYRRLSELPERTVR